MTLTRRSLMLLTSGLIALPSGMAWADSATTTTTTSTDATAAAPAPDAVPDFGIGDPAAKVKIVEYLSFTCPHCAHFHAEVYPKLKADYIDKGLVRLDYHEVYFDKYGLWGAMLARCGGEMRYIGIVDMLYDKQVDWAASDDPTVAIDQLKKIGLIAGIDDATADACLKDQDMAKTLVAHYQANIDKDFPNNSFQGTPSFIIDGVVHSNMAWEDLKKLLDDELAKS
jgi:protein-disulfide isomerase